MPRLRSTATLVALLALFAVGCGSDDEETSPIPDEVTRDDAETPAVDDDGSGSDESGAATTDPAADEDAVTAGSGDLPEGAEDLVGRWAHFDVVAYEDEVMNTMIISIGFADFELRDGVLWNTQRFCDAEMTNNQNIEITMAPEATSAIVPVDTAVEVTVTDDGRLRVYRPPTPTAIGIDLEDPANEPLPTDPNDPRISDDDNDGNPGITTHIFVAEGIEGDLYLARREIFSYDVVQESPDRMVGTVIDDSEQLVLGASDEMFAAQTNWVQHPDPETNPVIWERVDETWDCDRLIAERPDLFPPNPSVDY